MSTFKECIRCGDTKGTGSFRQYTKRDRAKPRTYLQTVCRECEREYARRRSFERRRGITLEERDELLAEQDGRCAACGTDNPGTKLGFMVDHDHDTGRIRGILCHHCNAALGHAKDDTQRLAGMILYLRGVSYGDQI